MGLKWHPLPVSKLKIQSNRYNVASVDRHIIYISGFYIQLSVLLCGDGSSCAVQRGWPRFATTVLSAKKCRDKGHNKHRFSDCLLGFQGCEGG